MMDDHLTSNEEPDGAVILDLFLKPTETLTRLLNHGTFYWLVTTVMCLEGLVLVLRQTIRRPDEFFNLRDSFGSFGVLELGITIAIAVLGSAITGVIIWWMMSLFCYWIGRWFRGIGSFRSVHLAYGWSHFPNLIFVPLLFCALAWLGTTPAEDRESLRILCLLFMLSFGIWKIVLASKALGLAHNLKSGMGFLILLIAGIFLLFIMIGVVIGCVFAFQGFANL